MFFLARTLGAMYFINNIADTALSERMRRQVLANGLVFAVLFVAFVVVLMLQGGVRFIGGQAVEEPNIYLHNLLGMWWAAAIFLAGVLAVLYGIFRTAFRRGWRCGIWWAGIGTAAVVLVLFLIAGYADTAYLPSVTDPSSSLSIANSSSSLFTLRTMSYVSVLIPFVLAYIVYVWAKMNAKPITETEMAEEPHQY